MMCLCFSGYGFLWLRMVADWNQSLEPHGLMPNSLMNGAASVSQKLLCLVPIEAAAFLVARALR
jgi:hypothetical protein